VSGESFNSTPINIPKKQIMISTNHVIGWQNILANVMYFCQKKPLDFNTIALTDGNKQALDKIPIDGTIQSLPKEFLHIAQKKLLSWYSEAGKKKPTIYTLEKFKRTVSSLYSCGRLNGKHQQEWLFLSLVFISSQFSNSLLFGLGLIGGHKHGRGVTGLLFSKLKIEEIIKKNQGLFSIV
jgi:hypothetical protein